MGSKQEVGRLALRVENGYWNAYYMLPDSTRGRVELGRVSLAYFDKAKTEEIRKERMLAFRLMMQDFVSDLLEEATGVRPTWPNAPTAAPFWEKLTK